MVTSTQTTQAGEWWGASQLLLTQTRWGMLWLVREAILLAIAALSAQRGHSTLFGARPWRVACPSAACVGLLLVQAAMGHAAGDSAKAWYAVPATALHLLAASLWVGGLLALAVGWLSSICVRRAGVASCYGRHFTPFGGLAAVSVVLLIATGLFKMVSRFRRSTP